MGSYTANLPVLTIANGGTTSNAVGSLDDADVVCLYAPSALTNTVTIQVEPTVAGTSFVDLTSAGSDVTIGAGNMVSISPIGFRQLRVVSSGAEGAERTFQAMKQFRVR